MGAQALGGDDEFAAQFSGTQQQNFGDGGQRISPSSKGKENRLGNYPLEVQSSTITTS